MQWFYKAFAQVQQPCLLLTLLSFWRRIISLEDAWGKIYKVRKKARERQKERETKGENKMKKHINFVHCYSNEECDVTILAEDGKVVNYTFEFTNMEEFVPARRRIGCFDTIEVFAVDNKIFFTKKNSLQSY